MECVFRGLLFRSKSPIFFFVSTCRIRLLRHFNFSTSRLNLRNRSDRRYSAQHRNVRLPQNVLDFRLFQSRLYSNDSRLLFSST